MTLVRLDEISIEFGDNPLLKKANFSVEPDERICLIGRNGAGKSTLMKIINGQVMPDTGEMHFRTHLRISQLEQALPAARNKKVRDVIREGLSQQLKLIDQYRALSEQSLDQQGLHDLHKLQADIDIAGGWNIDQQVETIISQLELPAEKTLDKLSGGWRRRVALGKALVSQPELLLLDEPTNHLDISTIEWLEHRVRGYNGAVIFITHDRDFLQKLATRIVEIDRGELVSWPGNYQNYLKLKEKALEEEYIQNTLFDKKLSEEETWIRQGVKARRTRNEGRVRSLEAMREQREVRIKRQSKAKIHIAEAEPSGRKVVEARIQSHGYNNETLIRDFKLKIMRGDRIGLIGNNGVGKSTLLKILLGQIEPDQGSIKLGTNLEMGYFDQIRRELEMEKSVAYNVSGGKEYIKVNGKDRHIIGYLKNFLFSPKRARTPVKALSGGECNRILLAKLFTQPSNLLILDEPTNDLDVEMLEVLEEQLVEYQGTLIIVSHDRHFLDSVVSRVLVFEEDGKISSYVGGYSDWARHGRQLKIKDSLTTAALPSPKVQSAQRTQPSKTNNPTGTVPNKPVKLSYKLQRELEMLPEQIAYLEAAIKKLEVSTSEAGFYQRPFAETKPLLDEIASLKFSLEAATERWLELEEMAS